MKKTIMFMAVLLLMSFSALAGAAEVDFQAKILNSFDDTGVKKPKLVGIYTFNELGPNFLANIGAPAYVTYTVYKQSNWCVPGSFCTGSTELIYMDNASISAGQTQVVKGIAKTGKITLTYDADTGQIESRFDLNNLELVVNGVAIYYIEATVQFYPGSIGGIFGFNARTSVYSGFPT